MLVSWKQNLKHLSHEQYLLLREMCHLSKNVYNESLYNIRQHYFSEGTYLRYEANYSVEKLSKNYKLLGANIAQQIMRAVDSAFKSFFALIKLAKKNQYDMTAVRLPYYLPKDGLYSLVLNQASIKSDGTVLVPMSPSMKKDKATRAYLKLPPQIRDKKLHQIKIIPRKGGKWFEAIYIFEIDDEQPVQLDNSRALAIDLGINNFATCVTSEGDSFIVDGKKVKSQNQWYNKTRARLSSIKDHQKISSDTKLLTLISEKRNRQLQNFVYCSAKYIVSYCVKNQIGKLVIGYNRDFQRSPGLGKPNNQKFVMLPFGKFKARLKYLCERFGIEYLEQEESYTSKASFFDDDKIPVWQPDSTHDYKFCGNRIYRGLYRTKAGKFLNADVNGALNILRKSNAVGLLKTLSSRGEAITPMRIRL